MMQPIGTKTITIDGRKYPVRIFESAESVASRKGRKASSDGRMGFERRHEAMAEAAYVNGRHPLSEPHETEVE